VSEAGEQKTSAEPAPTYEQARDELTAIVARLEGGQASLEESIALWERGEQLATLCQEWLDGARRRLAAATGERPDHPSVEHGNDDHHEAPSARRPDESTTAGEDGERSPPA
jgi:exodeoxyribonuclease VII small subunit